MKKTICFYFQIHIPKTLRRFRFFDIGNTEEYYDDFSNKIYVQKIVEECYIPMNKIFLDIIKEQGKKFKISFSITGEAIELMELYAPKALDSFKELADTGCVEFLCETYSHSLAFLKDEKELESQLNKHKKLIQKTFKQKPETVRLTGLIYSDLIGEKVAKLGFKTMLMEGAKHILGWKSPNYVYTNANNPQLKILLRNYHLSNSIAYHFSDKNYADGPITCEKFCDWLNSLNKNEEVINLFMDYLTFGNRQPRDSGIFEFMRYLPQHILKLKNFEFLTPKEVIKKHKEIAPIQVSYPTSWSEEERDLSIWIGNNLQKDALTSLCNLANKIRFVNHKKLTKDWECLQDSDHYYYMCTKWQTETKPRRFRNVYSSPFDAYINYMNILSDLIYRVNSAVEKKIHLKLKDKKFLEKISDIIPPNEIKFTIPQIDKIIELESNFN